VFISAYWQTGLWANFSRKYAELAALVVPAAKNPAKIRQTRKLNQGGYLRGVTKIALLFSSL
jgi:hypothetical protein